MKRNLMSFLIIFSIAVFFGTGFVWAGGRNHYSRGHHGYQHKGYHDNGRGWGYKHHWPRHYHRHYYDHGPRYYHYRHYGPPASYYYYDGYYPGYWGPSYNSYYFSGGISEPGFGFVFGTNGNW
jgi:hypothetical protein